MREWTQWVNVREEVIDEKVKRLHRTDRLSG